MVKPRRWSHAGGIPASMNMRFRSGNVVAMYMSTLLLRMRITARCGRVARDAVGHLYVGGLLAAGR